MATGTFNWYGKGLQKICQGSIAFTTDDIRAAMTTSSYTPNNDTDEFWGDAGISSNEVSGTGYTADGDLLSGKSVTYDAASDEVRFIATDTVWTTSTIASARVVVIYKDTGTPATCPLIGYSVLNADTSSSAGNFTLDYDGTNGLLKIDCTIV